MKWRVYYGDGSTFSDESGSPQDAPSRNVQVVVVQAAGRRYPEGRYLIHGDDGWQIGYYHWHGKRELWVPHDVPGLLDCLERHRLIAPGTKFRDISLEVLEQAGVKVGRTIADEDFDAILHRALNDPDIPGVSGG